MMTTTEAAIVRKTIEVLKDDGFRVEVSDTRAVPHAVEHETQSVDAILADATEREDDFYLVTQDADGSRSWVHFMLGNGADILADHGTNLTDVLAPVFEIPECR